MKTKTMLLLALFTMVIVSVSNAAVTVSIGGPYTPSAGDEVTIPVQVTGFDKYYAGQLIVDFGKVKVLTPTVESQSGYIYYPIADYGVLTKKTEWDALTAWYSTSKAAFDYGFYGSKFKIYFVAPEAQSETNGATSGAVFDLKFKVADGALPDVVLLGGELLNNNNKEMATVGQGAVVNISGYTPVTVISNPSSLTNNQTITSILDMGGLGGSIPSAITSVTLKNEDAKTGKEIGVQLSGGTQIEKADGTQYTGYLKPPEAKAYSELTKDEQDQLPTVWKDDSYIISVGGAEKLTLTKTALMLLKVRLKTSNPKVYYLPPNGPPEEAGVSGSATVEGKAYSISKGGTILSQSAASGGMTDYTIAVLLDHLSTYVVGPALTTPSAPSGEGGDGGTCFIATAVFGSASDWHVKTLRDFRDQFLLSNSLGKAFVEAYYKNSPAVAAYLKDHDTLRSFARFALLPVVGFASIMLYSPILVIVILLSFVGLIGGTLILKGRRGRR